MKWIFIVLLLSAFFLTACFFSSALTDQDIITLIDKSESTDVDIYKDLRKNGYSKEAAIRLINNLNKMNELDIYPRKGKE